MKFKTKTNSSSNTPESYKIAGNSETMRDYNDDESRRILEKWRSGIIICKIPKLFPDDEDDLRMI
jgi:hypothetical protein